jgi:dienelactone hydrolase
MKFLGFLMALALLTGCAADSALSQTPSELVQSQTLELQCQEDDPEVKRYLITKSQSKLGAVSASACGYPNSEYGPITVLAVATGKSSAEVVLGEAENFWIGNESRFTKTETGWELEGLIGNPYDGDEAILKITLSNDAWQIEIEELPKANAVSIQSLMRTEINGRDLELVRQISSTSAYKRYAVTYKSGELTISGIMNIPNGTGPFPTLVLGHGYIDPKIYTSGRGLAREQDYLARAGYIVLHSDYRNHAGSDDDPENNIRFRLGYVEDIVNAALALRGADIPEIDKSRIGYLGRSMGGGIGYQAMVAFPGVFKSYVLYAPTSANYADNFNRWGRVAADFAKEVSDTYGLPEDNPEFWANISAINFFDQVSEPVLIHHGTLDDSCNIDWSRRAAKELKAQGKDVTLLEYVGEYHAFYRDWTLSMQRTVKFLQQTLN